MTDDEKQRPPPGHFVSDELRDQTTRFLDELRKRLKREQPREEPKLGPPRRRR